MNIEESAKTSVNSQKSHSENRLDATECGDWDRLGDKRPFAAALEEMVNNFQVGSNAIQIQGLRLDMGACACGRISHEQSTKAAHKYRSLRVRVCVYSCACRFAVMPADGGPPNEITPSRCHTAGAKSRGGPKKRGELATAELHLQSCRLSITDTLHKIKSLGIPAAYLVLASWATRFAISRFWEKVISTHFLSAKQTIPIFFFFVYVIAHEDKNACAPLKNDPFKKRCPARGWFQFFLDLVQNAKCNFSRSIY